MQTPTAKHLLLFDIDGTLLRTHGGTLRAMDRAARAVISPTFSFEGIDTFGQLDSFILDTAMKQNGVAPTEERVDGFKERFFRELADETPTTKILPGVAELIDRVHSDERYLLGLVTGNYRASAEIKLRGVGIDPEVFIVGAFGGEATNRPELVRLAMTRAERMLGRPFHAKEVLIIGDTPRDVDCARDNGCLCLAVATGGFDFPTLQEAGADAVLESFGETDDVLAHIEAILS